MSYVPVSVVIICRNAAGTLRQTISSVIPLTNDIVVLDNNSTDGTPELAAAAGARVIHTEWQGYGTTKNNGHAAAVHDWVLSLDADETADAALLASIRQLDLTDAQTVYEVKRLNYLGTKPVRFGAWSNDRVTRLFNKKLVQWDHSAVHEQLVYSVQMKKQQLAGTLHHYTCNNIETYRQKLENYARLMAEKYAARGKKAGTLKTLVSPAVNFLQNYLLKAGFLDGLAGWQLAIAHARYTYRKYRLLQAMQH
jgi:glycosyltransferase involved in cell wall biosynthesis